VIVRFKMKQTGSSKLQTEIGNTPFLLGLSDCHLKVLADCTSRTHFDKGQAIFYQGETANRFYLIESGRVALEAIAKSGGRPVVIDTIGDGGLLGWSWLFEPYEWQFTARAISETNALFFYGTVLRERCETDPSLGFELLKRMSQVMLKRLQSARTLLVEAKSGFSPVGTEHAIGIGT
jgi:CRP/FNR family cyclic AMP-dependent transcriptional regulator